VQKPCCKSVSESGVQMIIDYIKNQKKQHQKKTFQEEDEDFMELYELNSNDE
jgi:hypothetical protein